MGGGRRDRSAAATSPLGKPAKNASARSATGGSRAATIVGQITARPHPQSVQASQARLPGGMREVPRRERILASSAPGNLTSGRRQWRAH
ncbi:MAG TPA: hypothetical protein VK595_01965, partial [Vicinamibacterales bacterium]|nr:hypothetical protein [Vicinamibacterales bacterium]